MAELQSGAEWQLVSDHGRLELHSTRPGGPGSVYVNFVGGKMGYSRRVPGERLLFRAIGAEMLSVIDATAGLGRDAFILACKGYHVTAIERSPIVCALLEDGLRRALADPSVCDALGGRLRFVHAEARDYLRGLPSAEAPDVVYLDPMFPPRRKAAQVKKESLALRAVVGGDEDAAELLAVARATARRHAVIKRMIDAPPLAPDVARSYKGKSTRFDVYAPAPVNPAMPPPPPA